MVDFGDIFRGAVNKLRTNNDFVLKKLELTAYNGATYDLTNIRVRLCMYSDIFQNCMSGTISIYDGLDLPQMFPLIGEEKLTVILTRPDENSSGVDGSDPLLPEYKMTYRIYKMDERDLDNDKTQVYVLHFVSEEYLKSYKTKVRKVYKDMPYSEMVEKIYNEFVHVTKPIHVEKSKFDQKFAISNLSPIEAINVFTARSISDAGLGEGYVFYEDTEKFNFVSLGSLLAGAVKEEYGFGVMNVSKNSLDFPKPGERPEPIFNMYDDFETAELRTLEKYQWSGSFDVLANQTSGMYNSKLWTYDFVRQVWEDEYDFDYEAQFQEFQHLGKEPPLTAGLDAKGDPLSHVRLRHTNKDHDTVPWISSREPGILPLNLEEYIQKRTSQLHQINNARISFTVSGDPRRKVGDVIEFLLPEVSSKVSNEFRQELDSYFKGKWLICAINHRLEMGSYHMDVEIIKDSLDSAVEHRDIIERYNELMNPESGFEVK